MAQGTFRNHIIIDDKLEKINLSKYIGANGKFENTLNNKFAGLINTAYNFHMTPKIKPDDILLLILSYVAKHVNKHGDYYRPYLADRDKIASGSTEKTEIKVVYPNEHFDINDPEHIQPMFASFINKVNEKCATESIMKTLECDFSTSTVLTRLTSQVTLAYMVEKYFELKMVPLCGIPSIIFKGTQADWESLLGKLDAFDAIAHPDIKSYLNKSKSVIKKILGVEAADWKKFYYKVRCGSGSNEFYGWILDLFPDHSDTWDPSDEPSTRIKYEFKFETLLGEVNALEIDVGPSDYTIQDKTDDGYPIIGIEYGYEVKKAQPRGWRLDGVAIDYDNINWRTVKFDDLTYAGKKLDEFVETLNIKDDKKLMAIGCNKYHSNYIINYYIATPDNQMYEYPGTFYEDEFKCIRRYKVYNKNKIETKLIYVAPGAEEYFANVWE